MINIDYKKSEENGWEFADKHGRFNSRSNGLYVYTDGYRYTTNDYNLDSVIARYDVVGDDMEGYYFKEEVPNHIRGCVFHYTYQEDYFIRAEGALTRDANYLKSLLPTRKEFIENCRNQIDESQIDEFNRVFEEEGVYALFNEGFIESECTTQVYGSYVPYLKEVKKEKPPTDYTPITCSTIDEFLKSINSVKLDDKYDWLKSQTIVKDGNITCCGLEVEHTGHGTKVLDNSDYWVSFAPNSSREYAVQYHKYIKSLVA